MTAETYQLLFFTELAGLPGFDLKQRRIGRVRDAAIVPLIHPARVDRFLVGAGSSWLSVRYDQIAHISLKGIQLSNERLYPYHSDEYMLRIKRDLLDQQIIDVNGRKVVRVNDVTLEIQRDERDSLAVLEVDVGVRGILRGVMMNSEASVLGEVMLLADAIVQLRDQADALESTHAVFLSDPECRITAQVPAARLFLGDPQSPLRSLADGRLISTRGDETQQRVTALIDIYKQ